MADVPPELSRLLSDAKKFANEYGALITLLALIPLGGIAKVFLDRQKNRPNLELELVDVAGIDGNTDVTFAVLATNLGEQPATKGRYTWTQRSSLTMTPVPANFIVHKGQPKRFEFSMRASDLIARAIGGEAFSMLGWLKLTYYAGWGLWKRISQAVVIGDSPEMPVELAEVPRKSWGEIITPLGNWQEKRLRDKDIKNLDRELQRSRDYLEARGIRVELLAPRASLDRLFGELQSRGWSSSYGSGGRGHEVYATKKWPSTSATFRLSANTMVDAATMVVASAIKEDEQHG
jgi:hypothetical protein